MQVKLHQIKVETAKKSYTYLAVILSKKVMKTLKPTKLTINVNPPFELSIKKRTDQRGYALLPNDLLPHFNFTKDQKVEITLKSKGD